MVVSVSTRISDDLQKQIDKMAEEHHMDRASFLRLLLTLGLAVKKQEIALNAYQKRKLSLWKAAELAGLSLWAMIDLLGSEGHSLDYTLEELKKDLSE
ncbi:MAG: UPF0175 family protein [Promethearchaeota archaeon]